MVFTLPAFSLQKLGLNILYDLDDDGNKKSFAMLSLVTMVSVDGIIGGSFD